MKMRSLITSTLLLLALLLPATAAYAYDFEVDGIYYNINGNEVTVTKKSIGNVTYTDAYVGKIRIPETVTYQGVTYAVTAIGASAFSSCSGLNGVVTGNSVTSIGSNAFKWCSGLTSVIIGKSVTSIGNDALSNCSRLSRITIASDNPKYDSRDNCNAIIQTLGNKLIFGCKNTVIPNTVTMIADYAFDGCSGLTSINIPSSVTYIGYGVFNGCNSLSSMTVDSDNPKYDSRDNCNAIIEKSTKTLKAGCQNTIIPNTVIRIADYAFQECSALENIIIPNSVTSIGASAFYNCTGLASVAIGNSVTTLGDLAFYGCSSLTSVDIPITIKYINSSVFMHCTGLRSVTIPNSVKSIKSNAFYNCCSLTSLTIPQSVTFIGEGAFNACNGLTAVYSYIRDLANVTVKEDAFKIRNSNDYSHRTLYVPAGTSALYQASDSWYPYFGKIVEMPRMNGDVNGDGVVDIADLNVIIDVIAGIGSNGAADVNGDGEINVADANVVIGIILGDDAHAPDEHEWVDLGLPSGTLWATCNVGANAPEEFGHQFAWGETAPKETYNWYTYKWCEDGLLTKYCNNSSDGTVDNKIELDPEDDAAYVNWGPSWRMPTVEQLVELYSNCTQQWTELNGVKGILVTGPNGNTMFLPAAGFNWGDNNTGEGTSGDIWSRELYTNICDFAYRLMFHYEGWRAPSTGTRSFGSTVRAVRIP